MSDEDKRKVRQFLLSHNVPHGTFDRLEIYVELLTKWQKQINLVSNESLKQVWGRHIMDSLQLIPVIQSSAGAEISLTDRPKIVDLGSGGGFPGLVLALTGLFDMTLVESHLKKIFFLKEVARLTKSEVNLISKRIEECTIQEVSATIATSRGFASIEKTCHFLYNYLPNVKEIFMLKGEHVKDELDEASERWLYVSDITPSMTHEGACIVHIYDMKLRDGN